LAGLCDVCDYGDTARLDGHLVFSQDGTDFCRCDLRGKQKIEIEKVEMNQGRLSEEFRDRTKGYASVTIRLFIRLSKAREEVRVIGKQLLRSGTSVAAHVREASRARSDEEFVSKLGGALQETDESQMWLELLREECGMTPADTLPMEKEADELMAIMTTMINKTKNKKM
jgi:four helix bundle protein